MRLAPGTQVVVLLNDEEYRFTLVASGGGDDGRLNVQAPLATLLGAMAVGDVSKGWTPRVAGAKPMRVEVMTVEVTQ